MSLECKPFHSSAINRLSTYGLCPDALSGDARLAAISCGGSSTLSRTKSASVGFNLFDCHLLVNEPANSDS